MNDKLMNADAATYITVFLLYISHLLVSMNTTSSATVQAI